MFYPPLMPMDFAARRTADEAKAQAREARTAVELMRMDVERLLMIAEALWGMLKEQHGYSDQQLIERVQRIDLRDGLLDGKVARQPPAVCGKCGRVVGRHRSACLYCGAPVQQDPFGR
jgi:hypothetical protein